MKNLTFTEFLNDLYININKSIIISKYYKDINDISIIRLFVDVLTFREIKYWYDVIVKDNGISTYIFVS